MMDEERPRQERRRFRWKPGKATLRLFPELILLETDDERAEILSQCWRHRHQSWRRVAVLMGIIVTVSILEAFVMTRLIRYVGLPDWSGACINGATIGVVAVLLNHWVFRKPMQRYLREQLLARGIPVCLKCGYDLRGQTEPRCPECGTPFDERLLNRQGEQ